MSLANPVERFFKDRFARRGLHDGEIVYRTTESTGMQRKGSQVNVDLPAAVARVFEALQLVVVRVLAVIPRARLCRMRSEHGAVFSQNVDDHAIAIGGRLCGGGPDGRRDLHRDAVCLSLLIGVDRRLAANLVGRLGDLTAAGHDPLDEPVLQGFLLGNELRVADLCRRGGSNTDVLLAVIDAVQCSNELVIFAGGNRIELVIVAARTVDRQPEKRLSHRARDFFQLFMPRCGLHGCALAEHGIVCASHQKTHGRRAIVRVRRENVAGQLHPRKPVIGHIIIERPNDPISIVPRRLTRRVVFVSATLAKTGNVQPMSSPALAIMSRRQQVIN